MASSDGVPRGGPVTQYLTGFPGVTSKPGSHAVRPDDHVSTGRMSSKIPRREIAADGVGFWMTPSPRTTLVAVK
jgi:hypothetical protein